MEDDERRRGAARSALPPGDDATATTLAEGKEAWRRPHKEGTAASPAAAAVATLLAWATCAAGAGLQLMGILLEEKEGVVVVVAVGADDLVEGGVRRSSLPAASRDGLRCAKLRAGTSLLAALAEGLEDGFWSIEQALVSFLWSDSAYVSGSGESRMEACRGLFSRWDGVVRDSRPAEGDRPGILLGTEGLSTSILAVVPILNRRV